MERTQVYLTEEQKQALKRRSERSGTSIAELIRQAIDKQLRTPDPDMIRDRVEKTYGSWSDRMESGATRTQQMRKEWSERIENGREEKKKQDEDRE